MRRECRLFPVDLVSARAFFFYCTRSCGCIEHPAFPAPSLFRRRENFLANLGRVASRDRGSIPRHCERERSNPESRRGGILDCFVASAPRNDGAGCLNIELCRHRPLRRAIQYAAASAGYLTDRSARSRGRPAARCPNCSASRRRFSGMRTTSRF